LCASSDANSITPISVTANVNKISSNNHHEVLPTEGQHCTRQIGVKRAACENLYQGTNRSQRYRNAESNSNAARSSA